MGEGEDFKLVTCTVTRVWQSDAAECVLRLVFETLGAAGQAQALARSSATCRTWRRVVSTAGRAWRKALLRLPAAPRAAALAALAAHAAAARPPRFVFWRALYVRAAAPWFLVARVPAPDLADSFTHAEFHESAFLLATASEDATVAIWERVENGEWRVQAQYSLRTHGWASVARVQWAPGGEQMLLATGPLALADRWELAVLRHHGDELHLCSRADGSAGTVGCWVTPHAFLSLQLRLLAPALAITTVWLNASVQDTASEYTGVATQMLQIFNEASTHLTHTLVMQTPAVVVPSRHEEDGGSNDDEQYYRIVMPNEKVSNNGTVSATWLVCACGQRGGRRGVATALSAWELPAHALHPPAVHARKTAPLRERAERHARRPRPAADAPPAPPAESDVRALCSPPTHTVHLGARVLGLVAHYSGRCLWASLSDELDQSRHGRGRGGSAGVTRAACVAVPGLRVLRVLRGPSALPPSLMSVPYHVQPAVNVDYVGSPEGGGGGRVYVWCAQSGGGAGGAGNAAALAHSRPALALLLPRAHHQPQAFVLTADALHELDYGRRQFARKVRESCTPSDPPACPACSAPAPPPCRAPRPPRAEALRVTCRVPPRSRAPPCPVEPPTCSRTCTTTNTPDNKPLKRVNHNIMKNLERSKERCGTIRDRVSHRLAAAEQARRLDYQREVAVLPIKSSVPIAPSADFGTVHSCECVPKSAHCSSADGSPTAHAPVTSQRNTLRGQPYSCLEPLAPDVGCTVRARDILDPCAHRPRVLVEIDRRHVENVRTENEDKPPCIQTQNKNNISDNVKISSSPKKECSKPSFSSDLKSRIMRKLGTSLDGTKQKTIAKDKKPERYPQWCSSPPRLAPAPPRCQEPTLKERLRGRGTRPGDNRRLHSWAYLCANEKAAVNNKGNSNKLNFSLEDRIQLAESGRGREAICRTPEVAAMAAPSSRGTMMLTVPAPAGGVRVSVSVHDTSPNLGVLLPRVAKCKLQSSSAAPETKNSWLSIKNLQKKISECRRCEKPNLQHKVEGEPNSASQIRHSCPCIRKQTAHNLCSKPQQHVHRCSPSIVPSRKYQTIV